MLQSISLCHRSILYVRMSSVVVKLDCRSDSIQTHPEGKLLASLLGILWISSLELGSPT